MGTTTKRFKLIYVAEAGVFGAFDMYANKHQALGDHTFEGNVKWHKNIEGGNAMKYLQIPEESSHDTFYELVQEYKVLRLLNYTGESF